MPLTRGLRRWGPNATSPAKTKIEGYCAPQTCRACGKALLAGMDAQFCGFATGGMYACTDCKFWKDGEQR